MCIHANTAASLFAWLQCRGCSLPLSKALGGGHARPSGCHILLNVALTPECSFSSAGKLQSSFSICWQIKLQMQCHQASCQLSFQVGGQLQHANTAASLFAWLECHDYPLPRSKALGRGNTSSSGCHILLNVALTPAFPFNRREVVVFLLHLLANRQQGVKGHQASCQPSFWVGGHVQSCQHSSKSLCMAAMPWLSTPSFWGIWCRAC